MHSVASTEIAQVVIASAETGRDLEQVWGQLPGHSRPVNAGGPVVANFDEASVVLNDVPSDARSTTPLGRRRSPFGSLVS